MGFFDRLFGHQLQGHTARITPATAVQIRRIITEQRLRIGDAALVIGRKPSGQFTLDISEDRSLRTSPSNAVANSEGIAVVLPRALAHEFADLVVDFEHGGFRFISAANPQAVASHPAHVVLSREHLFRLSPSLRSDDNHVKRIAHYLWEGDSRAAVITSTTPLVVAAYTSEIDAVALLRFPDWLLQEQELRLGAKLLTSNSYIKGKDLVGDLLRGDEAEFRYQNFVPLISDFLAENPDRVEARKAEISDSEWTRAFDFGLLAMERAAGRYRDGCPPNSEEPAY